MGIFADTIIKCGGVSLGLAERSMQGVRADLFARKPVVHGAAEDRVIDTNHPAFVFGHLALYPRIWLQLLDLPGDGAEVPATYSELFAAGKPCEDDPSGAIYPPMDELVSRFLSVHKAAYERLATVPDDRFGAPVPTEGFLKKRFGEIGPAIIFGATSHMMMHLGQVSAWRRCMGLGSIGV